MTAISVVISVNTIAVSKNNDDAMATLGNLILGIWKEGEGLPELTIGATSFYKTLIFFI